MIGTLARRITVITLDAVLERGREAEARPIRWAAAWVDHARARVGLDVIPPRVPVPVWSGRHPERPMWDSDRNKLRKWQAEQGIATPEAETSPSSAEQAATPTAGPLGDAVVKVFYKRGCPYGRAALDLLREREIAFEATDVKGDEATLAWLKIVTGKRTTPQVFLRGTAIGGYDELRALDQSGELLARIGGVTGTAEAADEEPDEITVEALRERIEDETAVLLLDVRTADEVRTGVIAGAVHVPLAELDARKHELDPAGVWIVYCHAGKRSLDAAARLRAGGFRSVASLRGGITAFRAAGGVISMEGPGGPSSVPGGSPSGILGPGSTPRPARRLPVIHPTRSPFEVPAEAAHADAIEGEAERLEGDALVTRVREVLDECRPMVQSDGGDIELLDIIGDVVHVQLTGNCVGCPSSQATLRQGIERRLKARIPQVVGIASPQLT